MSASEQPRGSAIRTLAALVALVVAPVAVGVATAEPAAAAARVDVVADGGGTTADPGGATRFTVAGSGFQSIPGGFGGVYVLFGTVDGTWQPSAGGVVGKDYRYVPDAESKDNQGFQRFVAFPGSDTEGAAQAVMDADGRWSVEMVVPGARFETRDRSGAVTEVDCLVSRCGILTIGAHGVKNAANETFTPIDFATTAPAAAGTDPAAAAPAAAAAGGPARVGTATGAARAGEALTFTAQGFTPGELVVATLDDGAAAVGPLTAGVSGEVAGVLPLPADLRDGTHLLQVRGAASASVAEAEIVVTASSATVPLVGTGAPVDEAAWLPIALLAAVAMTALLLLLSIASAVIRLVRGRRVQRRTRPRDARPSRPAPGAGTSAPPVPVDAPAAGDASVGGAKR